MWIGRERLIKVLKDTKAVKLTHQGPVYCVQVQVVQFSLSAVRDFVLEDFLPGVQLDDFYSLKDFVDFLQAFIGTFLEGNFFINKTLYINSML